MEKKIEFDVLDKIMSDKFPSVITKKWNGIDISVSRCLSFDDAMRFVEYVYNIIFSGNEGTYIPEIRDCALNVAIVRFYTDIILPNSIEEKYEFVCKTDIIGFILQNINKLQLESLIDAIDRRTEIALTDRIGRGKLWNTIESLAKKITEVLDSVGDVDFEKIINILNEKELDEKLAVTMLKNYKYEDKNGEGDNQE